ncbi:ABC transporter permease [Nocardioides sp. Kera G14]|uniref:ABC transporter permease n=1 Tax=Nocardioides sp. Kera G14 TaxID=2884264 RepID=UPI001D102030|nr:ABC transporter permease [Nocardioides sp. Kera G14]UDY23484.1 ABC transporter permease [Nocardioides sp. Kera G14]
MALDVQQPEAPSAVASALVPTRRTSWRERLPELIGVPVFVALIIVAWWGYIELFDVRPVILPTPKAVWDALVDGLSTSPSDPAGYWYHARVTMVEILAGFGLGAVVGLLLALLLSQVRIVERIVNPVIVAFQSVPKIAFAPLFIIWFGFGSESKIMLVSLVTFFPVLVAGMAGFKSVEPERLDVMRSLGASTWQRFTKLVLPNSLPFLFTGLEISLVQAITATIVAEFLAGTAGLGVLTVQMQQVLDTASIFAVMVLLGVIGWLLVLVLVAIRKRLTFWSAESRRGGR